MSSIQKKPLTKNKTIDLLQLLFGRLTERKIVFLYANFGEDDRTLVMGTLPETDLVFGEPELSLMAIRIKDDDLFYAINEYFKDFGVSIIKERRRPVVMNYRMVSAILNKYSSPKEYPIEWDPETKECYVWKEKKAKKGSQSETVMVKEYITQLIRSFFKFNQILYHVTFLTDLLDKKRDETCYIPWATDMERPHESFHITPKQLDLASNCNPTFFPIWGILTLGKDILNISAIKKQKYNIDASHLCIVKNGEGVQRIAHRVDTPLFTATLMRPYKVFFKG